MRTASAAAAVVILWDLGPRNGIVQEEIAAFCQIEAAFFEVAVCRILRSDGLEFALHSSDNDRSDNESYNDRQQDPNLRKGARGRVPVSQGLLSFARFMNSSHLSAKVSKASK